ncbi:hypothetical protein GGTG_11364 [Gaeumannomyces tritici R3-111a-1]|uniref:Uncharacterized protein n=1 Tax=Gaeumannomyces tritici (strain R3-111a-1) TaxID=644352 RepID=J3PCZ1_GAET3|nr:hypothetical protein GGTG_11364 [Gaeumannomyces tritici R3-111a-1]EJT70336.1 hypothetical protein GGTG_11364 [Gaeumannomyces tritici R3-111a-1]
MEGKKGEKRGKGWQSRNSMPGSSSAHAGNIGQLKSAGTRRPESPLSPLAGSKSQGGLALALCLPRNPLRVNLADSWRSQTTSKCWVGAAQS